ncbi:hypothetical protein AO372_1801 [Moraxella catarrhalis]|nr:hypothetical protein AO381_1146 [Moraxella catarrhalis]OAV10639.1 hypothetical protein AO377_0852 [Moraxella catarrhalis]OAV19831.1 hypothetical protein AO372_1801 [Moraxella catarrhalis]OAV22956.1 hypothetical protein AO371_1670 [Moraxella catarrhalis]
MGLDAGSGRGRLGGGGATKTGGDETTGIEAVTGGSWGLG